VAKPWSKVRERIERELVAAGVGTARTGVEHIDHHRRVQPRLDTHGDRLARRDEAGRRQQVVDEFHRLARARLVAKIEGSTDDFVQRRQQLEVGARCRHHHRKRSLLAPLTPPLTGLSIELMPREASRSWTSIAACRPTVEKSTKSLDA